MIFEISAASISAEKLTPKSQLVGRSAFEVSDDKFRQLCIDVLILFHIDLLLVLELLLQFRFFKSHFFFILFLPSSSSFSAACVSLL